MTYELDDSGNISIRFGSDEPVDPCGFREAMAGALQEHQDAGITLDLANASPLTGPMLAVVVQTWLAASDRGKDLTVSTADDADRAMLDRLGFDEFYRISDTA
ncbi:MAG: hypothetical protein AB8G96_14595 [Phycisphaerales bacterium]